MSFMVPLALFGWIPVVLLLFAWLEPRRAVVVSFLVAWLFLPMAGYGISGFPDYTKMSATCVGVLLGAAIFDLQTLVKYRFRWFDWPMLVWCVCPFFSSVSNGLGAYDGVAGIVSYTIVWGLPYLIGRVYFNDLEGLKELAVGIFMGGLVYVPFCLYEIRMSPQLHTMVYGFHQHSFRQTLRSGGGYRPTVFMQHGLMVGMWMTTAMLVGFWLWRCGVVKKIKNVPVVWVLVVLGVTTVLCKSAGALALLLMGIGVLLMSKWVKGRWVMVILLAMAPGYMVMRTAGGWSGANLIELVRVTMRSEERVGSLQFRMDNEDLLTEKALKRPAFGWGGWGRNRVHNDEGRDISVTDGLWVIVLGVNGVVGLTALSAILLLPGVLLVKNTKPAQWSQAGLGSAMVLVVGVTLYWIDCVPNGMMNPIFVLCAGGLTATLADIKKRVMI